jgi:hypothetical protein
MHSTPTQVGLSFLYSTLFFGVGFSSLGAAQSGEPPAKTAEIAPVQAATSSITRDSLSGEYDGGQMEVAARLLLKPDGHFNYELAYGALDEAADGTWDFKDGAVFLTTVPAVTPPRFVVESNRPDPRGGLWVKLSNGQVLEGAPQRLYLLYGKDDPPDMVEVGADGHVPLPGNRWPSAIVPEIPVYPIASQPIPITGTGGYLIILRFEPNDIGKADFRAQRLSIDGGVLVMPRRDLGLMLRFKRQDGHL